MSDEERAARIAAPAPAAADSREMRVLGLRITGKTYRAIAEETGISMTLAKNMVKEQLFRLDADEFRDANAAQRLMNERLEEMIGSHYRAALAGDTKATDVILRLLKQQAELWGLNAATRVDIEDRLRQAARDEGLDEETVIDFARRLKARSGT